MEQVQTPPGTDETTVASLSELQLHLLNNLHKLEKDDTDTETSWYPDEINNADRFTCYVGKPEIVSSLRDLNDRGLVESVVVLYSAWLKSHLTPAGQQLVS